MLLMLLLLFVLRLLATLGDAQGVTPGSVLRTSGIARGTISDVRDGCMQGTCLTHLTVSLAHSNRLRLILCSGTDPPGRQWGPYGMLRTEFGLAVCKAETLVTGPPLQSLKDPGPAGGGAPPHSSEPHLPPSQAPCPLPFPALWTPCLGGEPAQISGPGSKAPGDRDSLLPHPGLRLLPLTYPLRFPKWTVAAAWATLLGVPVPHLREALLLA